MNIHGLKLKKKKLYAELKKEEKKANSSNIKILNLRNKIKGISKKILEAR